MPTAQKETPASGDNHPAGVNTQNTRAIITQILHQAQHFAILQSRAAQCGYELHELQNGFMLARGSHSRHCLDLITVQAMLQHLEAK